MGDERTPPATGRVADLIREAADMIRHGDDPSDIVALLETGLPEADADPVLWYHLGYARLQAGDAAAGASALERSLALQAEPNTWLYLGYARIELADFDGARTALGQCLELGGPEQARYELAYACHVEGRHEDAARYVRDYVLKVADDPDGWELYQAVCNHLGRPRTYKRFLARHGDAPLARLLRGRDEFSMGAPPFPVPVVGEPPADLKLEFLDGVGAAYLGTSSDDAHGARAYRTRELSYRDVGTMLVRLSGVLSAARISLGGVVAADDESAAVAQAAAHVLNLPYVPPALAGRTPGPPEGHRVWLQVLGHDWLGFARRVAMVGPGLVTVVLGLDWFRAGLPFTPDFVPDVTGVMALDVTGFEGRGVSPGRVVDAVVDAAGRAPSDEATAQRHYYRTQPGLRFR